MFRRIKVWQNCEQRQQVTDQVTSRISEKDSRLRKVVRQEPEERADGQEGDDGNEVLTGVRRDQRERECAHSADSCAQPIHVVQKIERVNNRKDPENGDGVTE